MKHKVYYQHDGSWFEEEDDYDDDTFICTHSETESVNTADRFSGFRSVINYDY